MFPTGLLCRLRGGAQDSFTVREEKDITRGLPGAVGTSKGGTGGI